GSLRTREGLVAELTTTRDGGTLRVESADPRPLEIRLIGRRLAQGLEGFAGADPVRIDVRSDGYDSVITFPRFHGARTLRWREARR
ncbi:MAG TPA: hypothetical protein VMM12_14230, partial [Longimicrobiales bacterium]|nr:hypothetical protein [Longimicrobiales bacterium]